MRTCCTSLVSVAVLLTASLFSAPAFAVNKKSDIEIEVKRHPNDSTKDKLLVGPRGVGACKKAADDCELYVKWYTKSSLGADHYLLIETVGGFQKNSGSTTGVKQCFPKETFVLHDNHLSEQLDVESVCPAPAIWFYQVTYCEKDDKADTAPMDSDNCKIIMGPVDPGVIIDTGRGGP